MACFAKILLNFAEKYTIMSKDTLKITALLGTIILIIAAVAWFSYSEQKRANEALEKALEEDRKYSSEQQQKEAEEKLEMLHDILTIDAQRVGNDAHK